MNQVVLLTGKQDHDFFQWLFHQLKQRFSFYYYGNGMLQQIGNNPAFCIYHTEQLRSVVSQNSLLVVANHGDLSKLKQLETSVLIHSENTRQLKAVSCFQIPTITCGMSQKDFFTFSSVGVEKSVVSLQRELNLLGNEIEPMEIPVYHSSQVEQYGVLCYAAIVLGIYGPQDRMELS